MIVTVLEYVLLAVLTVLLSIELSKCVDALDKKSNLSGAFIGGVMLAAVTSLPELFTSLTAVLSLGKPQLVQGNVLGSNIFNLTIFALVIMLFTKRFMKSKIAKTQTTSLYFCISMFLCVIGALYFTMEVPILFTSVHVMSIVILVLYIISSVFMKGDDSGEVNEGDVDLTLKQIVFRFILFSILLVAVSILLTMVTDRLSEELQLGATVAGAIFLGVATSLPELSSSLSLGKMGNFNASVGNIVGSCVFNFTILCFADVLYTKGGIYDYEFQTLVFALFGILSCVLTVLALRFQKSAVALKLLGVAIIVSYVVSIVLSM